MDNKNIDELFREYNETSDVNIRNTIVENYYYMAETLAQKFRNRGVDYDDLLQVASLALIKAVERYSVDSGYGAKFTTFATPTIIGEIKKYFRDKAYAIRMPRKHYEAYPAIKSAIEDLTFKLGKVPTAQDIAEVTGYTEDEILETLESTKNGRAMSIDQEHNEDGFTFSDLLGNSEDGFEAIENNDMYERALDILNETEKKVMLMRHEKGLTQKEIAQELGVSQMYISRLERKVYKRLYVILNPES